MSQVPNNLSQQQIQQAQTKAVTQLLQAPNAIGMQKTLINVNGANSKLKTNKNGIIKYTLENPIKINIGDKITLVQSFIEERGLSEGTITFDEDVNEEIRFLYYKQGDLENTQKEAPPNDPFKKDIGADVNFASYPNLFPDCYTDDGNRTGKWFSDVTPDSVTKKLIAPLFKHQICSPTSNYINTTQSDTDTGQGAIANVGSGANGLYYYLMEWFNPYETGNASSFILSGNTGAGQTDDPLKLYQCEKAFCRPLYGQVTIKIPAGNYSVSAVSDLLNQQLNGTGGIGDEFNKNPIIEKMFYNT